MEENKNEPVETTDIEIAKTEPLEIGQPTASLNEESQAAASDEPTKKEGLWTRIVHSKDSTKLVASVAFCAVFVVCTLFAVTAFGGPLHSEKHGSDARMEQSANAEKGAMSDKGIPDRSHGRPGMGDFEMRENRSLDGTDTPDSIPTDGANGFVKDGSTTDSDSNDQTNPSNSNKPSRPRDGSTTSNQSIQSGTANETMA